MSQKAAIVNKYDPGGMAEDQGHLVQGFGEVLGSTMRPVLERQQLDAEGEKPAPGSGPGSELRGSWTFQGPVNAAAIRTDTG